MQPLAQLRAQCGDETTHVYELGGTLPGTLLGNAKPVYISANVGEPFAVWASFNDTQLTAFSVTSPTLQSLCRVYTTGEGGGPAGIFEARAVGHFEIQTQTASDGCIMCPAILGFQAEVTAIKR